MQISSAMDRNTGYRETLATGAAGTEPRFMAQPPLLPAAPIQLHREDGDYSPVERAVRLALGR